MLAASINSRVKFFINSVKELKSWNGNFNITCSVFLCYCPSSPLTNYNQLFECKTLCILYKAQLFFTDDIVGHTEMWEEKGEGFHPSDLLCSEFLYCPRNIPTPVVKCIYVYLSHLFSDAGSVRAQAGELEEPAPAHTAHQGPVILNQEDDVRVPALTSTRQVYHDSLLYNDW